MVYSTPPNHYLEPILVALFVVLRAQQPDLFNGLCKGSITPANAMTILARLPGGAEFVAGRSGVLIESYLLAGEANDARTEARYAELDALTNNASATQAEQSRAKELGRLRWKVPSSGHFRLTDVAAKIDLAALVKD